MKKDNIANTTKETNKTINRMCKNCTCLNVDCKGTTNQVWTGCVYKK